MIQLPTAPMLTTSPPPAAPVATPAVASGDFLLMLGQLLGAPVAQAAGKPVMTASAGPNTESSETADDAAALLAPPFPLVAPWNPPQNLPVGEGAADALKSLDLPPLAAKAAQADLAGAQLSPALLEALNREEAAPTSGPGTAPASQVDTSQQLRATPAADTAAARALHNPVGSSAWADELGTRMSLMAERGQHSASLRLSPEHLGPLEVRIAVRDDQASVWFGAAHADTRAAIEQALPRLRELFASQGLLLADAGVHHEAPRDQPRLTEASSSSVEAASAEAEAIAQVGPIRLGLVDAYA